MTYIHRSITILALIDDVWEYLTETDKIAEWLMPNTFVAQEGHHFTMDCPPGIGSGAPVRCEVKELKPPHDGRARLVYTWVIDSPYTETLLEIDLVEVAEATAATSFTLVGIPATAPCAIAMSRAGTCCSTTVCAPCSNAVTDLYRTAISLSPPVV